MPGAEGIGVRFDRPINYPRCRSTSGPQVALTGATEIAEAEKAIAKRYGGDSRRSIQRPSLSPYDPAGLVAVTM
jgi:hypothetical protein